MRSIRIGDIAISQIVETDHWPRNRQRFFPDGEEALFEAARDWLCPRYMDAQTGDIILQRHAYVLKTGGKSVFIDTCYGNGKQGRSEPDLNNGQWPFLENLKAAGFAPGDIDFVCCTHLHADHAGWNTRLDNGTWVPTFANAAYLTNAIELDYVQGKHVARHPMFAAFYEDSILPVIRSNQIRLVSMDHQVTEGIRLEPSNGHTPGHVSVHVQSGASQAIAIGDMMHSPIQALYPDWNSFACEDAERARLTRRDFLARVADSGTWVLPAHFDPCRVGRADGAFRCLFDGP